MTLTPQTPYIPSTPTDQKTLFTVEVSVVFLRRWEMKETRNRYDDRGDKTY